MEDHSIPILLVRYSRVFLLVLRHCFLVAIHDLLQLANLDFAYECQARSRDGYLHWFWIKPDAYFRLDICERCGSHSTYHSLVGYSSDLQYVPLTNSWVTLMK